MEKKRLYYFDNLKLFLIFFVVLGHFIEPFINENQFFLNIFCIIYIFHMPLFALVSGFFSKKNDYKGMKNIIKIFIVFEILYAIVIFIGLKLFPDTMLYFSNISIDSSIFDKILLVLSPIWILWYLISLVLWRLALAVFGKSKKMIILAIIISCLAGVFTFYGRAFSFQRTLVLFPFFLSGYYLNYEKINSICRSKISNIISYITIISVIVFFIFAKNYDYRWVFYSEGYNVLGYSNIEGILIRIAMILTSSMILITILKFMPHKKFMYSNFGTKTLEIYLFHGFMIIFLYWIGFFKFLFNFNNIFSLIILILFSLITLIFYSREWVSVFIEKIIRKKEKNENK